MEIIKNLLFNNSLEKYNSNIIISELNKTSFEQIFDVIFENKELIPSITSKLIPQFSNINDVDSVLRIINDSFDEISRQYIGYMINKNASELAQTKYGENHLKLTIMLGLATENPYSVTSLGKAYLNISDNQRSLIRTKLTMRIPLVQYLLVESKDKVIDGTEFLKSILSEKTAIRRRSNAKKLIGDIRDQVTGDLKKQIYNNIIWS